MYIIILETLDKRGNIIDWESYDKDGIIYDDKEKYNTFDNIYEISSWCFKNIQLIKDCDITVYDIRTGETLYWKYWK